MLRTGLKLVLDPRTYILLLAALYAAIMSSVYAVMQRLNIGIIAYHFDRLLSLVCTLSRWFVGAFFTLGTSSPIATIPNRPLRLFDLECCPYCRRVREAISVLELDNVEIYPCPRTTFKVSVDASALSRFRPHVLRNGGKMQVPYFEDDNFGVKLYESEQIVEHLWRNYNYKGKSRPLNYFLPIPFLLLDKCTLFLPSLVRSQPFHRLLRVPSKLPAQLLEFYNAEWHPDCRLVREALCCLELPYISHNSRSRTDHRAPYLIDPQTRFQSSHPRDIAQYLYRTYFTGQSPKESFVDAVRGILAAAMKEQKKKTK